MRICETRLSVLSRRSWSHPVTSRAMRTRSLSPSRAIKQLSNTELLSWLQKSNEENHSATGNTSSEAGPPDRDGHSQSLSLPQSPLIEPHLVAARARYLGRKPTPSKERSAFQLKLEKNPYAQALCTPPRLCLLTGIRLPSYFMIPFGVAKHPKTGSPWHLPRLVDPTSSSDAGTAPPSPASSTSPNPDSTSTKLTRTVTGTHFVASQNALVHISTLTKQAHRKLVPFRWKDDPSLKVSDMVWREDMATFVLGMLRRSIVRDIKYLTSRPAAYIAACENPENIPAHKQVAALLWLGSDHDASTQYSVLDGAVDDDERGPPLYAMYHYKDRYIPYFNLSELLGQTHAEALRRASSAQLGNKIAVVKAKRPTTKLQLKLWKITGYLDQSNGGGVKTGGH